MPIREMTALTRRCGEVLAVDGLTLSVEQGEIFGLLVATTVMIRVGAYLYPRVVT